MANPDDIPRMTRGELLTNLSFYRKFDPETAKLFQTELDGRVNNQPSRSQVEQQIIGQMTLFETNQRISHLQKDMRH